MRLNRTDEKALNWILKQEGIGITEVVKGDCPDFMLRNGNSYEAKRLYGENVLLFTKAQWDTLLNRDRCKLLVFDDGNIEPTDVIDCKELGSGKWDSVYKFKIVDDLGVRANIWLSRTLYGELERLARKEGLEVNDLIREVLEDFIAKVTFARR